LHVCPTRAGPLRTSFSKHNTKGPFRRSGEISRRAVGPQGPLYKRGSQVGVSWNRRWVTLTRSDLTYSYGPVGGTVACASDPFVCLPNLCLAPQHPACRVSSREQCTVQRARSYRPCPGRTSKLSTAYTYQRLSSSTTRPPATGENVWRPAYLPRTQTSHTCPQLIC